MTRTLNADRLMSFIRSEAQERAGFMKDSDGALTRSEDVGFLNGLEVVAQYVVATVGDERDPDDSEMAA